MTILKRVEDADVGSAHLQTDILHSFRASGMDEAEADEATWDTLGIIATAGPNILQRFSNFEEIGEVKRSKIAISAIALAAPVLDSRTLRSGKPYSFPAELETHCDSGKSYHFWMSAFLAHRLRRQIPDVQAAAAATFILEKGYQMKSETGERKPLLAFTTSPLSDINNRARIDLAFAAAGSWYGAEGPLAFLRSASVDQNIANLITKAPALTPLTVEEAQNLWDGTGAAGYFRWQRIFSPNEAFWFFH